MENAPLVSVIIPTFGRPEFLSRAISSVHRQTYPNKEIIVVDDNGEGNEFQGVTAQVVENLCDDTIVYVVNHKNLGGGGSRNVGVKAAKGELVAFLDDDDEWSPEFIQHGVRQLEKDNADVVYCDCWIVINGDKQKAKLEINEKHIGNVWNSLLDGWCPSSTSLFILRRSLSNNQELFDAKLSSFQDLDCWLSISKQAVFTVHNFPSVYKHRHNLQQITTNTTVRRQSLEVLENKWLPRMSQSHEVQRFKNTLARLECSIDLTEFRMLVGKRKFSDAARIGQKYLIANSFAPKNIYLILKQIYLAYR